MKWKLYCSFLLIGLLVSCNPQTKILLQEKETSIHNEPSEFDIPETTTGTISFDYYINSGFIKFVLKSFLTLL